MGSAELSLCRAGQGEQALKDEHAPNCARALSVLGSKGEVQSLKCHGGSLPTGGAAQAPQQLLDEAPLDRSKVLPSEHKCPAGGQPTLAQAS